MCPRHWAMVPQLIRTRVVVNFNSEQCKKKIRPTVEWLKAAREAINYVKELENE